MEDQIIHEETLIDRDVEVGSGLGNMINSGKFEMPSMEDIMKLIDGMKDISDEERENLKSSIMFPDTDKMRQKFESATQPGPGSIDYFLFMAMIGLIALVFGLFGYKLYKSLMEKKLKKQEKQKNNKKSKKIKQK